MSYLSQDDIASNVTMQNRVAQSAAQERVSIDPDAWTFTNRRTWSSAPGWDAAWESAKVSNPGEDYDPGSDAGVITDGMILSQVQAMLTPPSEDN